MAGLFDFFGGGPAPTPGLLDAAGYMDPAQYDAARRQQSMQGLWAGLLQGGGPSLEPRNFGSALGAGLGGMNQFGNQFDESQLQAAQAAAQRSTVQKNIGDLDIKKKGYELTQEWIRNGGVPTGAPGAAGAPGGATAPGNVPNFGGDYKGEGDPASLVKHYESGGNYNIGWGGADLSNAPRDQYGFPQWAGKPGPDGRISHAAGAYQFQPGTWARYAGPLGIKDFSQESQDKVFAAAFAAEGWKPWAPYNARLRAAIEQRTAPGAGERTTAAGTPIPDFTEGRSALLGGPSMAAAPAPGALAAAPPAAAPAPGAIAGGAPPFPGPGANARQLPPGLPVNSRGEPYNLAAVPGQRVPASAIGTPQLAAMGAAQAVPPRAGEPTPGDIAAINAAAIARAQQQRVAASGGDNGIPASVALDPGGGADEAPAPAPGVLTPGGAIRAPAPAPAAVAMPPAPAGGAPAAGGPVTVTLPAPPTMPEIPTPQQQPLPPAPGAVAIPPRPVIPGGGTATAPAVSPEVAARARQAQGVVLGLTMMGVTVPDFLQKEAGIATAGRQAAAEAEARQPIELQNKQFEHDLTAAQKRWDALTDQQKETLAFQRGLTKDQMDAAYKNIHEQYKSVLGLVTAGPISQATAEGKEPAERRAQTHKTDEEIRKELDAPITVTTTDERGDKYTYTTTRRAMQQPGAGAAGGAPVPGGIRTELGPQSTNELQARGTALGKLDEKISADATLARGQRADLKIMQTAARNLANQGILSGTTQFTNQVINALTGQQADRVAAYELVTKNSEKFIRDATRESDSQPAAIQLVMTRNSMPGPRTSEAGFDAVLGQMLGVTDYKDYKARERDRWLADPANRRSLDGFEGSLKVSPYAFMIHNMPEAQKAALKARLQAGGEQGKKEMRILADQLDAITAAGF